VKAQPVTIHYKDTEIEGQRLDLIVGNRIVVEIKAIEKLAPVHEAQLISYLRSTDMRMGLLINFNQTLLKHGVKRIVN